jgi:hypothetical protein
MNLPVLGVSQTAGRDNSFAGQPPPSLSEPSAARRRTLHSDTCTSIARQRVAWPQHRMIQWVNLLPRKDHVEKKVLRPSLWRRVVR